MAYEEKIGFLLGLLLILVVALALNALCADMRKANSHARLEIVDPNARILGEEHVPATVAMRPAASAR